MEEKEKEIRKLLGDDYHLCINWREKEEWYLYRKYDDTDVYFSEDNKPVMTSKDYSIEDYIIMQKNTIE